MRYFSFAIGLLLFVWLLTLPKLSFLGAECYVISQSGPRGPSCLNSSVFTAGIFLALIVMAAAAYYIAKDFTGQPIAGPSQSTSAPPQTYQQQIPPRAEPQKKQEARTSAAWKTLTEFDNDIQSAVTRLKPFGDAAEERLATAYLAVSDKSLLPSMVTKITADFEALAAAEQQRRENARNYRSISQKKIVEDRSQRSVEMLEQMKKNGMFCQEAGKRAVSAEIYLGDSLDEHGYAKLVYEDGTAELRSGRFFMPCKPDLT